jgi:DNA-directed RNA polymerase alpha subunit
MHEYTALDGVKESILQIMSNFKKIRFKTQESVDKLQWIRFTHKGVGVVHASDLKLPA